MKARDFCLGRGRRVFLGAVQAHGGAWESWRGQYSGGRGTCQTGVQCQPATVGQMGSHPRAYQLCAGPASLLIAGLSLSRCLAFGISGCTLEAARRPSGPAPAFPGRKRGVLQAGWSGMPTGVSAPSTLSQPPCSLNRCEKGTTDTKCRV